MKAIFTKGISGAGKSFWTSNFIAENPEWEEINRDNIRTSLYGRDKMYKGDEQEVTNTQKSMIASAAQRGKNIVISDTNLNNKLANSLIRFVENLGYSIEWKDFTSVPLDVCLEHDSKRQFPVGAEVIKRQYYKYVVGNKFYREPYLKPQDETLPKCIITDFDGTVTISPHKRSPYDMSKVLQDEPNKYVINLLELFVQHTDVHIFIFSGREEKARQDSLLWLKTHAPKLYSICGGDRFEFVMRKDGDSRRDSLIKREFYDEHVFGRFEVLAVLDDRKQVCVETWGAKALGLPLFRIGDPEADF